MNLQEITPGLDFIDTRAFLAIPVMELIDGEVRKRTYVITSDRDKFLLDKNALLERGFYSMRYPAPPQRWSGESLENFLLNGEVSSLKQVFSWIEEQYGYYIDFGDPRIAKYIACWVIGTYFHRLFSSYPYIHLNGTMESGKSKTLMVTAQLAFNGQLTVNSTASYIIRTIHDNHATCCIDEIEYLQKAKDDNSIALIGMYNAGYKKDSFVGKTEQNGRNSSWEPKQFEAYSPKIFASINGLEPSLASRTIPIEMVRSVNNEIKNRELSGKDATLSSIRDELYSLTLTHFIPIKAIYEGIKDTQIVGREWELWKPILTIAKVIDPELVLYEELHQLALEIGKNKKETVLDSMVTPKILDALETLMASELSGEANYSVQRLVDHLTETDEEAFGWLRTYEKSGQWIGRELRKAGVYKGRAEQEKINGVNTKVYHLDFDVVRKRLEAFR